MERNYEFEMEFLIGVIAAVGGASALSTFKPFINTWVTYSIVFVAISHIVLLTVVYSTKRGTDYSISSITIVERASTATLWVTTFGAIVFVSNLFVNSILSAIIGDEVSRAINHTAQVITNNSDHVHTGIQLILTAILPAIAFGYYWGKIRKNMTVSNNIDISIVPDEVYVRSTFEDSRPLSITVRNHSEETISVNLESNLPESVLWREAGERSENRDEISESAEIIPDRQSIWDIEFRHNLEHAEKLFREIDVTVSHDYGEKSKTVDMQIDSYQQEPNIEN
ncbi:hypothetical protein [Halosimplex amylolyticum]|uniref:hypothetical protein n=1 Tax=Halosimplex amylolyticum TaxID=3396616 RepID=UPI003F562F61